MLRLSSLARVWSFDIVSLLLVHCLLEPKTIVHADQEGWNVDALTFSIVSHNQIIRVLEELVVNDECKLASILLDVLRLLHKVAVSSVEQDDWLVALFGSLSEMLVVELAVIERQASILVLVRVMDSAPESGAIRKVSKVAK